MKVLIIEDNRVISDNTAEYLRMKHFQVVQVFDGEAGFEEAFKGGYDCIVLDRTLPNLDGLSIARMLKSRNIHTPIIFLTAKDTVLDRLAGLELGADDYMTKPFDLEELALRIKNVLKRASMKAITESSIIIGNLAFDLRKHTVLNGSEPVQMSPKEYAIVEYLLHNRWSVIPKMELYDNIWKHYGDDFLFFSNTLNVHLSYIRKKLWNTLIRTIKEVWYIID